LILFSSALEPIIENRIIMNKLVIDVINEKIFLMIITKDDIYNITKENTKINYEKLTLILKDFLNSNNLKLEDIKKIYVNRGPGSFAGIRNSLSIVKAINVARKVDYYCYSLEDFKDQKDVKYEDIPNLCDKFKIKKNLIKPIYLS
jgi:tRNA A37 threonylcarbamoyladenosine modification protein TsaB